MILLGSGVAGAGPPLLMMEAPEVARTIGWTVEIADREVQTDDHLARLR